MTDRELLGLAAKAAGLGEVLAMPMSRTEVSYVVEEVDGGPLKPWNPFEDDGDALRLLCKLKLSLNSNSATVGVGGYTPGWDHVFAQEQIIDGDAQSAHRRAIVRAAAEIGKAMQEKR